jgi:uncharacterized protein (TIGR00290 family)
MGKKAKILLSWSGGKDSAVSLFEVKSPDYLLRGLLTTYDSQSGRIQGHHLRKELIDRQAASLEIPLVSIPVTDGATNQAYEAALAEGLKPAQKKGLQGIAYGDIHLADIKAYRERALEPMQLEAHFPLWGWDSREVLRVFWSLGFKAIICAIQKDKVPATFLGQELTSDLISRLPSAVDPCGENGEYHSFVYDGPFFQNRVAFQKAEVFEHKGMLIQDLVPGLSV